MKWFHRHKFDPEKWKLLTHLSLTDKFWFPDGTIVGHEFHYINTCLTCGELVFKKLES